MDNLLSSQERRIYRAEARLIGSLLRSRRGVGRLATHLKSIDFHDYRHQLIWSAMLSLYQRGMPVSVDSVLTELFHQRLDDDAGGMHYLNWLVHKPIRDFFSPFHRY
jgi:replicative DNA helicase